VRFTLLIAALAAVVAAGPAWAEGYVEASSVTRVQLRSDLEGALQTPLYEDLWVAFETDGGALGKLSGRGLLKLGSLAEPSELGVDLYLLALALERRSLRLDLGRQLAETASGLRILDGARLRLQPRRGVDLGLQVGWLRDTELNDFGGGALLVGAGIGSTLWPGARLGLDVDFRTGPGTSPRADGRLTGSFAFRAPAAPRPWFDLGLRLDKGRFRRARLGLELWPTSYVAVSVLGRFDQPSDTDGFMAQRILDNLSGTPMYGGGARLRLRLPHHLGLAGTYGMIWFEQESGLATPGHSVDVELSWSALEELLRLGTSYGFRLGDGGSYHAAGLRVGLQPHRVVRLRLLGELAPFLKLREGWQLAAWVRADLLITPLPYLDLSVGGEYRSGALLASDLRFNAALGLRLPERRLRR
jgi:hypothetical protein